MERKEEKIKFFLLSLDRRVFLNENFQFSFKNTPAAAILAIKKIEICVEENKRREVCFFGFF